MFFDHSEIVSFLEKRAIKKAIKVVIDNSTYQTPKDSCVRNLEQILSKRIDSPVLGVNSGTDALIIALKAYGIGHGDEVIVPSFSFISTASSVMAVGATPVFIDINSDDYGIDSSKIEEKINSRTRAIIVAHLFGRPAMGIEKVVNIAKRNPSIAVIEDAAQAFGSRVKINDEWKFVGTLGDAGCFSFSYLKPFAAPGNAGALVFHEKNIFFEKAKRIRSYGEESINYKYSAIGLNSRMQEVHAAALIAKMKFADYWLEHRKKIAMIYREQLQDVNELVLPTDSESTQNIWYRYIVRTKKRDALYKFLTEKTVNDRQRPSINYPVPLPYFSVFGQDHRVGDFPMSESASAEVISLPIFNATQQDDALKIAHSIRQFFSK